MSVLIIVRRAIDRCIFLVLRRSELACVHIAFAMPEEAEFTVNFKRRHLSDIIAILPNKLLYTEVS